MKKIIRKLISNPPMYLSLGFMAVILIGSILLSLPIAQERSTGYLDCLFTATSAVCVTGLVTVTTATNWTLIGKIIILILIQIGGLGFMTMSTIAALIFGKRITLSSRLIIQEQTNSQSLRGMVRLIRYILGVTFIIEFIGAVMLATRFIPRFGIAKGAWFSVFHSISAFCNAGFDILGSDSLISYRKDGVILMTIAILIVIGGIGFSVITDLTHRKKRNLELHTKIVLSITAILIIGGAIVFFMIESSYNQTLSKEPFMVRVTNSIFQSVTLRTAGYASIDQKSLHASTSALSIFLMFIGGSPAGTAGGIKTTTLAILIIIALSEMRGSEDVEIFNRRIRYSHIRKSIALLVTALAWVFFITMIISIIEPFDFTDILFEVTSAAGTVGLTRNLTPKLSAISDILIILSMFLGRVGILSFLYAINKNEKKKPYKEAFGNVIIG